MAKTKTGKYRALFGKNNAAAQPTNYEGFPTCARSLEERTLQALTTGTFDNTFYASAQTLAKEAVDLCRQMARKDAELFAKMLVFARNEGLLRTVPLTGLVILSGINSELFAQAFPLVVRTPNDLKDFVTLARKTDLRQGLGRAVKTAINHWLNVMSEYHAIKYGSRSAGSAKELALRDVLRLTHPKPVGAKQDALFGYLINGLTTDGEEASGNAEAIAALLPQVEAFERLKAVPAHDRAAQKALIAQGRLPYEVVVGAVQPDSELWKALLRQMPTMALLRHLNTLERAGVFADAAEIRRVVERLTDARAIRKSRLLPFRFFTAYQTFSGPKAIREAIADALEISFANFPGLGGTVCIAPDVSGSMSSPLSGRGVTRYIDIGALFAAALLKKSAQALIMPFETQVVRVSLSPNDTLMHVAEKLARIGGGGTAVSAPISELLAKRAPVDTFIGITDNEEWARDRYGNAGFLSVWREYVKRVNPNAKAFLLTLAPYGHAVAPQTEPNVYFLYGWNDSVLDYITWTSQGQTTQLERVRQTSLRRLHVEAALTPELDADIGE